MTRRKSRFRNRSEVARVERAPREPAAPAGPVDLASQYGYVVNDLVRVGIIAVILIGAMVALRIFVIK